MVVGSGARHILVMKAVVALAGGHFRAVAAVAARGGGHTYFRALF